MVIQRPKYLEKLIRRKNNGMIKIVTGIRRVGKSFLLFKLFKEHLTDTGVKEENIIQVALDDRANKQLRDPDNMLAYVKQRVKDDSEYYILLDEVQYMAEFEDVLNSFLHIPNADVYVTGSNSKFLSSDIATEFRGRGDEIRVHPLSFSEYCSAYEGSTDEAWDDFVTYGSLPTILFRQSAEEKTEYLSGLFNKVYITDIAERNNLRYVSELDDLIDILASATGSYTNALKIANTFKTSKGRDIDEKTVTKYIEYIADAFLINKAVRYDVKGRKYIGTPYKYYFEDVGLRNVRLNFRQLEENHLMENIIYNELRIRGYNVDVGMVTDYGKQSGKTTKKQLEIDFIATLGSEKYYLQSAFSIPDEAKRIQESRPLNAVNDSFKKIIVVRDDIKLRRDEKGIVTIGIKNFLSDENSLKA